VVGVTWKITPTMNTRIGERRRRMMAEDFAGEGATAEPPPDTLAALLTAALSATLADAVSALVGAAYDAQIVRIEPHAHGGRISSSRLSLVLWTTRSPLR
jgi:hypothetical protein